MKLILSSILIVLMASCWAQNNYTQLNATEFEKAIATDSVQILDVRTKAEFNSGYIKNALQANWNDAAEFEHRIGFMNKSKPVYVYCLAGARSNAAALKLREWGFTQVFELKGGINAWKSSNKMLVGKINTEQMQVSTYNKIVSENKLVLVDIGANWCPPCKQMEPILNNLQQKYAQKFILLKVDGGVDETILQFKKVTSLPVFIIYKDGKEVWRKDGVCSEEELEKQLQ